MSRFRRINREFGSSLYDTWYIQLSGAVLLTLFNLWSVGFFTGYFIESPVDSYLDEVEFSHASWFEIVSSDSQVDGRFALCDEPFMLFSHDTMLVATKVEGGNAPCDEYGLNTSLAQGRWEFASPSGATPQARIWSADPLVVHTQMQLRAKVGVVCIVFNMVWGMLLAAWYLICAVKRWNE